jgi:type VI secretion system protein ImpK
MIFGAGVRLRQKGYAMAGNDPFSEPQDGERTVIKPNPGGRLGGGMAATPQPPVQQSGQQSGAPDAFGVPQSPTGGAAGGAGGGAAGGAAGGGKTAADSPITLGLTGMNRLNACAATLFSLVSRIRNRAQHLDPDALRRNVVAEVRGFESRALSAGLDPQQVKVARYAICATLDDVVLNTPWGENSSWGLQSMVATFHRETVGGDRFYDLLARLEQEPQRNLDLLEFLYMCLSLGFEGRLRIEQGGGEKHLNIRAGLARLIRAQRGPVETDLSPHWAGVDRPHRRLSAWKPVWIATIVLAVLLSGMFIGVSWALSGATERVAGRLATLDGGAVPTLERLAPPPPPPPPPPPQQLNRVKGFLEQEIADGIVEVSEDVSRITILLAGSGMFGSGSDVLTDRFRKPLENVGAALEDQPGQVIIAGHSDAQPIATARFPNNMALSLARADSVRKRLEGILSDPARLSAEGRGDKEPIADNATREGRAKNRRIEIILLKAAN